MATKTQGSPLTTSNFHVYLNGIEIPGGIQQINSPAPLAIHSGPLEMGYAAHDQYAYFVGYLSHMGIWNRALSFSEMKHTYNVLKAQMVKRGITLP